MTILMTAGGCVISAAVIGAIWAFARRSKRQNKQTADDLLAEHYRKRYDPASMDRAWHENWRIGDRRDPGTRI